MTAVSTEFYASTVGGDEPRVLARFITDEHGVHVERLDRQARQWVPDGTVAGFLTGHDDWAERVTRRQAEQILRAWQLASALLDLPVVQPAST